MNRVWGSNSTLLYVLFLLVGAPSGVYCQTSVPAQGLPEGTPPQLREPWVDRAVDLRRHSGIQVLTDGDRDRALRLLRRVATVRTALNRAFGALPFRSLEAPRLLVFEDLGEMRFTLRTYFGVEVPPAPAVFVDHPDGGVVAVTTNPESSRGAERTLQAAAFRQYAEPRFGEALPRWVEVGLSEYVGQMVISGDAWESGHVSEQAIRVLRRALAADRVLPLNRLIRLTPDQWVRFEKTHGEEVLYAQAWLLVHFLRHGAGGVFAEGFSQWIAQVAAGMEPTESFQRFITSTEGGISMDRFEEAWHASIMALEPSVVLAGLEQIELLRLGVDDLEREGIRPSSPMELLAALAERPPIEHTFFEYPYDRTASSLELKELDPSLIEFLAVKKSPRTNRVAPTSPPAPILMKTPGNWEFGIEWVFDEDQVRWVPWVWSRPRR